MSADAATPSSPPPAGAQPAAAPTNGSTQIKVPKAPMPNEDEYRAKLDKANKEVESCQKNMVRFMCSYLYYGHAF